MGQLVEARVRDKCLFVVCSVFFFQAEDGIRDLVRSRGLGDVYKRQALALQGLIAVTDNPLAAGWTISNTTPFQALLAQQLSLIHI